MKSSTEDLTRGQWLRKGIESAVVGGAACIATSAPSVADVASPWGPEASNQFRLPERYRVACPALPGTKKANGTGL